MKQFVYGFILAIVSIIGLGSCTEEAFDIDKVNKQTILVFLPWTGGNSSIGLTEALSNNIDSICAGIKDKKGLNNTRVLVFFSNNANNSTLFALIIGGHGCGWSCAEDWINYPNQAKPFNTQQTLSYDTPFSGIQFGTDPDNPTTRFFGSVDRKENSIDLSTLVEGIKQSGIKMQYILFDVCYMGNVETAYELKDVTNYLVASSSEIMAKGIPYRLMWSYLNGTTPNYSSLVNGIVNFYKNSNSPYCNMAAIDCRQLDALANVMKEINQKYTLDTTIPLDSIQPLDGFLPHLSYDMAVYVDSLRPNGYLKEQFSNQLKKTVKAAAHTDCAYTALRQYPEVTIKIKNYCGLSISDPSQHPVAIRGKEKTGWWKATHE